MKNRAKGPKIFLEHGPEYNYRNLKDGIKDPIPDTRSTVGDAGRDWSSEPSISAEQVGAKIGRKIDHGVEKVKRATNELAR